MSELIQLDRAGLVLSAIGNRIITDQTLLKLIKYDTEDCLSQSDLSSSEIVALCGKGSDPISEQRIFKAPFNRNIKEEVRSEIRFFAPTFSPNNIYLSEVTYSFQVIVHNSIQDLDDGRNRILMIVNKILALFNGADIGGIGELQLRGRIGIVAWSDNFTGYQINLTTRLV